MRWPGTIRAVPAVAGSGGGATQAAQVRITAAGAEGDTCRRAGSARRRILGASAEPDTCHRGAGGPGSTQRRRYSGATGRHLRYRKAEPDRGAGQHCSTESVRARRVFGWRPCRWRSIGRVRRYFGAEVRVRRLLGGWLPMQAPRVPGSPVATSAPKRALGVSPDGGPSGASAGAAGVASAGGFSARAAVPGSPVATSAAKSVLLWRVPRRRTARRIRPEQRRTWTREPVHSRHQSPRRRHIPAAVRRHIWQRDGGRCCYRDPLTGTALHLFPSAADRPPVAAVAEGGGPEPSNLVL